MSTTNPTGLAGISFVEFASANPDALHALFAEFGFSRTMRHATRAVDLYEQGDIVFLVNREAGTHASAFTATHGPAIVAMGWKTTLAPGAARDAAVSRGARAATGDHTFDGAPLAALYGIGESLIYWTPAGARPFTSMGFVPLEQPDLVAPAGFRAIDHLTNNVVKGTMAAWSAFYKDVFGFTEVRYFDIRGAKTGLTSYALRSPCGTFSIPINEGTEAKSQINEYLEEYKGPGVQHLALMTDDLLGSLAALDSAKGIRFLDMDAEYYTEVFQRVPNVVEDHAEIQRRHVLVDGDDEGYLLQIFTHNVVGPIFIELIQRRNHLSFGEGNFGALFRSIERDQQRRGYLT
jgi:4-hydroxyphenylpyruvate dioxygenase